MKYLKKFEELKTKQFSELDTWSKPTPIKRVRKVKNNVFDLTKSDLKKITDKGWDYDVTTFSRDEYDFFKNEMDSDKIYKPNVNLPIVKNNGGFMTDFVKINNYQPV